jgi:hypothetical protein
MFPADAGGHDLTRPTLVAWVSRVPAELVNRPSDEVLFADTATGAFLRGFWDVLDEEAGS